MNDALIERFEGIHGSHKMRDGVLAMLNDTELQFSPGGNNEKLGQLLKSLGDLEYTYIQSLETGQHDGSYHNDEMNLSKRLTRLKSWFADLDAQMTQTLDQLSEEDLQKPVDRANGVSRTVAEQLEIYTQAMLIFFGKLVVYFNAMGKPLPDALQQYIA